MQATIDPNADFEDRFKSSRNRAQAAWFDIHGSPDGNQWQYDAPFDDVEAFPPRCREDCDHPGCVDEREAEAKRKEQLKHFRNQLSMKKAERGEIPV